MLTTSSGVEQDLQTLKEFNLIVGAFTCKDLLEGVKSISIESLIRQENIPTVLPSSLTSIRAEIDSFLMKKKLNPVCVFESNIISSVIRAAGDGMGITFLPYIYINRELKSEKLVSVTSNPLWKHQISLISAKPGLDEGRKLFADRLIANLTQVSEQVLTSKQGG